MANSLYQPTFMAQKEKTVTTDWTFYTQKSLYHIRQVKYSSCGKQKKIGKQILIFPLVLQLKSFTGTEGQAECWNYGHS